MDPEVYHAAYKDKAESDDDEFYETAWLNIVACLSASAL